MGAAVAIENARARVTAETARSAGVRDPLVLLRLVDDPVPQRAERIGNCRAESSVPLSLVRLHPIVHSNDPAVDAGRLDSVVGVRKVLENGGEGLVSIYQSIKVFANARFRKPEQRQ
jgi:hypothetical protein